MRAREAGRESKDEGERFYWHDNPEVSAGRFVQRPFGQRRSGHTGPAYDGEYHTPTLRLPES